MRKIENMKSFKSRVLKATGVRLKDIPSGNKEDLLQGSILCRRGNTYVVTAGYPAGEDEDGVEFWARAPSSFLVVAL
jgi:hypothetical protein